MQAAGFFASNPQEFRVTLLESVQGLTQEQLDWTPSGFDKNPIGWHLAHIAQSEDWFVRRVALGEEMTARRRKDLPDLASLVAYLQETRARTLAVLAELPAEQLQETRLLPAEFRGRPRGDVTLHWIFTQVFWHESYHLGQIRLLLRLQGLTVAAF